MWYRWLLSALVLLLVGASVVAAQSGYLQPFDGAPPAPQPYPSVPGLAAWDVTVHSRDNGTYYQLEPMEASHGAACEGPPATHHLAGAYADAVFQCNNHVMTALLAEGYGVIYLTPPVVADWTDTPSVIQWDMSTFRSSGRDWIDLWVSPMADHLQLPLEGWLPDLTGVPLNAVHVRLDNGSGGTMFRGLVTRNHVETDIGENWWTGYESFLTGGTSAARRDTFQLTLSRTHIKFGMPAYNFWWFDNDVADLGWTQGVVQFGHHSYNPTKDCPVGATCAPNTWHWDNVSISPGAPFTITRAVQPFVDPTTTHVDFPAPATAGSHLRFAGLGDQYQISLDGGSTWQAAALQPAESVKPEKAQSYWTAVPAGTQQVEIRGQGGWWGSWIARDISLWGQVSVPPSQRTPTPTSVVPTRTPTPVPSVTPGPTATDLPTPTSLPTLTPSAVPAPTATPTRPPRCGRWDVLNGGVVFTPYPDSGCMQ